MLQKAKPNRKSQSALEYMMTYGWAILIIVIVAGVLYSLGIFSPSSSLSSTVTGFSNLGSVAGECTANGVLRIDLGDSTGYPINITSITAKSSTGQISIFKPNSTIDPNPIIQPTSNYIFSVPNVCPATGSRYSLAVTVNYTEPSQIFPGPYTSTGTVSGTSSSLILPEYVAEFFGQNSTDGGGSPISTIEISNLAMEANSPKTFSMWVYMNSISGVNSVQPFIELFCSGAMSPLGLNSGSIWGSVWLLPDLVSPGVHQGEWYYTVLSYNNATGNDSLYVNGDLVSSNTGAESWPSSSVCFYLGYPNGHPTIFSSFTPNIASTIDGFVSNLQYYNHSLSPAQIKQLYTSGLTGKPISGMNIDVFWPLNGSAVDYSGNGKNGIVSEVLFTSNYQDTGLS
jgi:hypothetical protein